MVRKSKPFPLTKYRRYIGTKNQYVLVLILMVIFTYSPTIAFLTPYESPEQTCQIDDKVVGKTKVEMQAK